MEAPESQVEKVAEDLNEHAHHTGDRWIGKVALSSAILAALAAVTASLSGHFANDAMGEQIKATDQWALLQAKGIKLAVLETRIEMLESLGKPVSEKLIEKKKEYEEGKPEIQAEAALLEKESRQHLTRHERLAVSLAIFQVAIAVGAISALTKRPRFWVVSLGFGAVAVGMMVYGILPMG